MRIEQTISFMDPVEYGDGNGFRTLIRVVGGDHYLISEVHREHIDEVMVFPCSETGDITDWGEVHGIRGGTTEDAISAIGSWSRPNKDWG